MRQTQYRYRDEWVPNHYPPGKIGDDIFVVVNKSGGIKFLAKREYQAIYNFAIDESLFKELESTGHILTRRNADKVFDQIKDWMKNSFGGPYAHLLVITKRCNLDCHHCHMLPSPATKGELDTEMSESTMGEVLRFAFSSPQSELYFEFQGGEPFLNYDGIKYFVEKANTMAVEKKKIIKFGATTNLSVINADILEFCRSKRISLSVSLNGSPRQHNDLRQNRSHKGSFEEVFLKYKKFRNNYSDVISSSPQVVVVDNSIEYIKEAIDFFVSNEIQEITLMRLQPLGNAVERLAFRKVDYNSIYIDALEYIYRLNKEGGASFRERMFTIVIQKILSAENTMFVDWSNPSGALLGAITYDWDGEILPMDEARSLRQTFGLGNVRDWSYDKFFANLENLSIPITSFRDRSEACRECSFNPLCGVNPVLEYARSGEFESKPNESLDCLWTKRVLVWALQKLTEDPAVVLKMAFGNNDFVKEVASTISEMSGALDKAHKSAG